jgi:hypothetical protein
MISYKPQYGIKDSTGSFGCKPVKEDTDYPENQVWQPGCEYRREGSTDGILGRKLHKENIRETEPQTGAYVHSNTALHFFRRQGHANERKDKYGKRCCNTAVFFHLESGYIFGALQAQLGNIMVEAGKGHGLKVGLFPVCEIGWIDI